MGFGRQPGIPRALTCFEGITDGSLGRDSAARA